MAKKHTKSDQELRQADHLEKKVNTVPEQTSKKPKPREDFSQTAARIVKEATENH